MKQLSMTSSIPCISAYLALYRFPCRSYTDYFELCLWCIIIIFRSRFHCCPSCYGWHRRSTAIFHSFPSMLFASTTIQTMMWMHFATLEVVLLVSYTACLHERLINTVLCFSPSTLPSWDDGFLQRNVL